MIELLNSKPDHGARPGRGYRPGDVVVEDGTYIDQEGCTIPHVAGSVFGSCLTHGEDVEWKLGLIHPVK